MVGINMEMPNCCAECDFDIFDKCLLTRNIICGDRLLKGTEGRLNNCPLVNIEEPKTDVLDKVKKAKEEIDQAYEEFDGYDPQAICEYSSRVDEILDRLIADSEE